MQLRTMVHTTNNKQLHPRLHAFLPAVCARQNDFIGAFVCRDVNCVCTSVEVTTKVGCLVCFDNNNLDYAFSNDAKAVTNS